MAGQQSQESADTPARCRLFSIQSTIAVLLIAVQIGCASAPKAARPQAATEGPWTPEVTSQSSFNQRVSLGPFLSSDISLLHAAGSTREPAPEGETVQIQKLTMVFDLEHVSGVKASIRAGMSRNENAPGLGIVQMYMNKGYAGSVTMNDKVVGEFQIDWLPEPPMGKATEEQIAGVDAGTVSTSVGTVRVIHRVQPPPPAKSKVGELFRLSGMPIEEFLLEDRVVATRRRDAHSTVEISPDLPLDVQFCIAAAMTVQITQDTRNVSASRTAQLTNTAVWMGR